MPGNTDLRYHISRLNKNPQHISCRVLMVCSFGHAYVGRIVFYKNKKANTYQKYGPIWFFFYAQLIPALTLSQLSSVTLNLSGYYLLSITERNQTDKSLPVKFLNFRTPENFDVIYLKSKRRGKTLGYFVKKMQMEKETVKTLIRLGAV